MEFFFKFQRKYASPQCSLRRTNRCTEPVEIKFRPYQFNHLIVRINNLDEHMRRVLRVTKQIDKQLDSLLELHYAMVNHRTNQVMRILTVMTCIFMPLTLITGIYGMNFEHMEFLKSPDGYHHTLMAMLALAILMISFLFYRRWM